MQTIHVQWTLPNPVGGSGTIAKLTIFDTFANVSTDLAADATSFDTGDVTGEAGDHSFIVTVIDTAGNKSDAETTTTNVPAAPPVNPNPVTGLTSTLVTS